MFSSLSNKNIKVPYKNYYKGTFAISQEKKIQISSEKVDDDFIV